MNPDRARELKLKEKAQDILFSLDLNTCVCDCLGCKTNWCGDCELGKYPPYKNNDLCCQNDTSGLEQALCQYALEFYREKSKGLVEALIYSLDGCSCDLVSKCRYCDSTKDALADHERLIKEEK